MFMQARREKNMAESSEGRLLLDELRDFVLPNVRFCSDKPPIGSGAYGVVLEVEVPGAVCAAKVLHAALIPTQTYVRDRFVKECKLLSTLRHPRIVQFLGLCSVGNSSFPALVMERLHCSLDDVLEQHPLDEHLLPLELKRSILYDVTGGLSYLHSLTPHPIVHRDLSAKNVLLNSAMEAKIADFGVARIVENDMTPGPGALVYMPPEALGAKIYTTSVDVFSFGHLMLYTLTQTFPCNLLPSCYTTAGRRAVIRLEIDRRAQYIDSMKQLISADHPFINLTCECLANDPNARPKIQEVAVLLQRVVIPSKYNTLKLDLIKEIEQLKKKDLEVDALKRQLCSAIPFTSDSTISWNKVKEMPFGTKGAFSVVLDGKVYIGGGDTVTEEQEQVILVYDPDTNEWSQLPSCHVMRFAMTHFQSELVIVGGHAVRSSSVPGRMKPSVPSNKIWVWNKHSREWFSPYPSLPEDEPRKLSSAVGYKNFLIVVGGRNYNKPGANVLNTLILDANVHQWYKASPLPSPSKRAPILTHFDTLYIFGLGQSENCTNLIPLSSLCVRLGQGTCGETDEQDLREGASFSSDWKEIPPSLTRSAAPAILDNRIILAGGRGRGSSDRDSIFFYNIATDKWEENSISSEGLNLPVSRSCCIFATLPNQKVLLVGGSCLSNQIEYCTDVYMGKLSF